MDVAKIVFPPGFARVHVSGMMGRYFTSTLSNERVGVMARKVKVHLVDDIDGTVADAIVRFSLDGVEYEIDLSDVNATKLRENAAPFVRAAHRVASGRAGAPDRSRGRRVRSKNQDIREWAKRSGIEVNDYGRIPRSVVQTYEASVGR